MFSNHHREPPKGSPGKAPPPASPRKPKATPWATPGVRAIPAPNPGWWPPQPPRGGRGARPRTPWGSVWTGVPDHIARRRWTTRHRRPTQPHSITARSNHTDAQASDNARATPGGHNPLQGLHPPGVARANNNKVTEEQPHTPTRRTRHTARNAAGWMGCGAAGWMDERRRSGLGGAGREARAGRRTGARSMRFPIVYPPLRHPRPRPCHDSDRTSTRHTHGQPGTPLSPTTPSTRARVTGQPNSRPPRPGGGAQGPQAPQAPHTPKPPPPRPRVPGTADTPGPV